MRVHGRNLLRPGAAVGMLLATLLVPALAADCDGTLALGLGGVRRTWQLTDGGIAAFAKLNINIDGYAPPITHATPRQAP